MLTTRYMHRLLLSKHFARRTRALFFFRSFWALCTSTAAQASAGYASAGYAWTRSLASALWGRLFGVGEFKIVMVGLDNAGKTTLLYRLHLGDVIETQPTVGSNVEEVNHRNVRFQVWDLGGQDKLREI